MIEILIVLFSFYHDNSFFPIAIVTCGVVVWFCTSVWGGGGQWGGGKGQWYKTEKTEKEEKENLSFLGELWPFDEQKTS